MLTEMRGEFFVWTRLLHNDQGGSIWSNFTAKRLILNRAIGSRRRLGSEGSSMRSWSSRSRTCWSAARLMGGSEEHTSELQSLMSISYSVLCLRKTTQTIH